MRLRYMFMVLFIKATVKLCSEAEWGEECNEIKITREKEPVNKPGETKGNLLHWKAAGRGSLAGGHRQSPIQSSTLSPFHFPHLKVEGGAVQIWYPLVSESMLVQVCDRRMELKGMPRILISSFPSDSAFCPGFLFMLRMKFPPESSIGPWRAPCRGEPCDPYRPEWGLDVRGDWLLSLDPPSALTPLLPSPPAPRELCYTLCLGIILCVWGLPQTHMVTPLQCTNFKLVKCCSQWSKFALGLCLSF